MIIYFVCSIIDGYQVKTCNQLCLSDFYFNVGLVLRTRELIFAEKTKNKDVVHVCFTKQWQGNFQKKCRRLHSFDDKPFSFGPHSAKVVTSQYLESACHHPHRCLAWGPAELSKARAGAVIKQPRYFCMLHHVKFWDLFGDPC